MSVVVGGNQPLDVSFRATLTSSEGVMIRTNPNYRPSTPYHMVPGQTYTFTGHELAAVWDVSHLEFSGVSSTQIERSGILPEGHYQLCVAVIDYNHPTVTLSPQAPAGCSNVFTVSMVDPPILLQPGSSATIPSTPPPTFSWTPVQPQPGSASIQYRLLIVPVYPNQTATDALRASTLNAVDRTLSTPGYLYQPTDPVLRPNGHYAWSVTAIDPMNRTVFRNGGKSEARDFYCDDGGAVTAGNDLGNTPHPPTTPTDPLHPGTTTTDNPHRPPPDTTIQPPPDSVPAPPVCQQKIVRIVDPKMDGGLDPASQTSDKMIHRDDFIPLRAIGKDYDQIQWVCIPIPNCPDKGSDITVPLTGRVKFAWEIIEGEGSFVKLGCLPDGVKNDEGDNIIFEPPYVPLNPKAEEKKITKIKITTIDDNPTQPIDDPVEKIITITTKRRVGSPDFYAVDVKSDRPKLPGAPGKIIHDGTCKAVDPKWEPGNGFKAPTIVLPGVADDDKIVAGEWVVLKAEDQRDEDILPVECHSAACTSTLTKPPFEDNVEWNWTVKGGGRIIGSPGRFVIYEAPQKIDTTKDKIEVTVSVIVSNPEKIQFKDKDSDPGEKKLVIYRPGVQLDYPPLAWLPEEDNSVDLKSRLVYRDGGKWNPSLAHMCRIHFFEVTASHEPGKCMNDPVMKEANKCIDLSVKEEKDHEAFNPEKGDCKDLYKEARSKKPVKEYSMTVYSHDWGAYGSLVSFANINKHNAAAQRGELPQYQSVPWQKGDAAIAHPDGREKKSLYTDNRVQVPRDVDENFIADDGWSVTGGKKIKDPVDNSIDKDAKPKADGEGDGLTAYEEYRGFRVEDGSHVRTDPETKDIFLTNKNGLDISVFEGVTKLDVHTITADQYNGDKSRVVNFNASTPAGKTIQQCGLYLVDRNPGPNLLGLADGGPAPPNWTWRCSVDKTKLGVWSAAFTPPLNAATKEAQTVAHELSHGCNTYHHGEGPGIPGHRSGNVDCIMRYDNFVVGAPEAIGSTFCNSPKGTGTNANGAGFGNADKGRGNCEAQPRISARDPKYPKR